MVRSSSGPHNGQSFLMDIRDGKKIFASRGINIYGLNQESGPMQLFHLDLCRGDQLPEYAVASQLINDASTKYSQFVIVVHDSAMCSTILLDTIFSGSNLQKWREIKLRSAYIGVFDRAGNVSEVIGEANSLVRAKITEDSQFVDPPHQRKQVHLPLVAHAGGGFNLTTYTNSLDALDANASAYKLFEIDLSWTSDNKLVCLHDWGKSYRQLFNNNEPVPLDYKDFVKHASQLVSFKPCALDDLTRWLVDNPDARVITDIKERNVEALSQISDKYPHLMSRFIPQVYEEHEYHRVRQLGYADIIWSLYKTRAGDDDILDALTYMDLYGLTLSKRRIRAGLALKATGKTGVLVWVHTVNTLQEFKELQQLGAHSIYTDWLR